MVAIIDKHDCCIRMTALLKCFEWTLNKPHNRTGDMVSTMLSMPVLQVSIMTQFLRSVSPSHSIDSLLVSKGGMVNMLLSFFSLVSFKSSKPYMV